MWRFFICICCGVFSQTSGNGLISSYLTTILNGVGITKTKEVTLINGCISIWSWIVGVACAILTAKFRRRTVFLTGTTAMLVIFIGWTIAQARYNITGVPASGYAVIALIFIYNAAYAFSWLVLVSLCSSKIVCSLADILEKVVAYPIEVAPYKWRARMWALTMFAISVSAFFNQYVNVSCMSHSRLPSPSLGETNVLILIFIYSRLDSKTPSGNIISTTTVGFLLRSS